MIDKMHVMHARRTGRHARQARQTAVNMFDRSGIRLPVVFQHVLDEVNPTARAVQLVAQHLIGRAGCGAKPAMHTGPQDFVAALGGGALELLWRKCRLHGYSALYRIKIADHPLIQLAKASPNHGTVVPADPTTRVQRRVRAVASNLASDCAPSASTAIQASQSRHRAVRVSPA